jgi:molecular chaperone DnaK (HSP70)
MGPNQESKPLTPSAVLICGAERVAGERAKRSTIARPDNAFLFVKRRMFDPNFVFIDRASPAAVRMQSTDHYRKSGADQCCS